jgi:hypothetical protein
MRIHRGLGDSVSIEKPNLHTRLISGAESLANAEESIHIAEPGGNSRLMSAVGQTAVLVICL